MVPAQSLHNKASDTFARLVMSYSFYKAITSSEETPRDWNFTSLHHLYVLRYPLWQIAIPHPIRSDLALLPCFSFFEQKMILNKGRLGECKRSIIPSGSLSHKDPLCVSTLNTLHTKAKYRWTQSSAHFCPKKKKSVLFQTKCKDFKKTAEKYIVTRDIPICIVKIYVCHVFLGL